MTERKVMEQALAALRNTVLCNMEQLNAMYALQEELAKPGMFEEKLPDQNPPPWVEEYEKAIKQAYLDGVNSGIEAEREACAKLCDHWPYGRDDIWSLGQAIRERGR